MRLVHTWVRPVSVVSMITSTAAMAAMSSRFSHGCSHILSLSPATSSGVMRERMRICVSAMKT